VSFKVIHITVKLFKPESQNIFRNSEYIHFSVSTFAIFPEILSELFHSIED
jgi:hypothetical protein